MNQVMSRSNLEQFSIFDFQWSKVEVEVKVIVLKM